MSNREGDVPDRPDLEEASEAEAGRRRKRRRWLWWVIGSVLALVLAPLILFFVVNVLASLCTECSDAERAALTEFRHYGGTTAEPEAHADGGCFVTPRVGDPPEDVIAYYREQLTAHGWILDESDRQEGETSGVVFETGGISAHRGALRWDVIYEAQGGRTITLVVYAFET